MKESEPKTHKLTILTTVLMIFTSVYGFVNISRAFYLMSYAAIIWYILASILFLIPYVLMMSEFGTAFSKEKGGFYSWMEKSVNSKYAFIGIFMIYMAFIIWMLATANYMWVPFSTMISGYDATQSWSLWNLSYSQIIGFLAILWILFVTFVSSKGVHFISALTSIGGIAVLGLNLLLVIGAIVFLFLTGFEFKQPIEGIESFLVSPNPAYQGFLPSLAFMIFAIYAYLGTDMVGGLVDKMDNPLKTFPKALKLSVLFLLLGYCLGIFFTGAFVNWADVLGSNEAVNFGNVIYVVMNELGVQLSLAMGLSLDSAVFYGSFLARISAFFMFLTYIGAFFTFIYSPLKQLIEGTPKEIWPKKWVSSKKGMPVYAMWVQALLVCTLIALLAFGGESASSFFDRIVNMSNVCLTLPFAFLSFSYIKFKLNDKIEKPFVIIKSKKFGVFISLVVTITIVSINIVSILEPLREGDIINFLWMIGGPVIFSIFALILFSNYEKRKKSNS